MTNVLERISELEHIQAVAKQHGIVSLDRWAAAEIAEMRVVLKRMRKAPVGAGAR